MAQIIYWVVIIGFCIAFVVIKNSWSHEKEVYREEKLEADKTIYKEGLKNLSNSALKELCSTMWMVYGVSGVDAKQLPENYSKLFIAASEELKNESRVVNNPVSDRKTSDYCEYIKIAAGVGNKRANAAMNKGLDYGIITNSAADMALYSALDTSKKIKNVRQEEGATMRILKDATDKYCKEVLGMKEFKSKNVSFM